MAYGYLIEAEYESGFVLTEDDADRSPYDPCRNVFHAIVEGRPTAAGHGRMVRFSLVGVGQRFDVDWTTLPETARPIYFREMRRAFEIDGGWQAARCLSHHFGYQYTDASGSNVQEVHEIPGG